MIELLQTLTGSGMNGQPLLFFVTCCVFVFIIGCCIGSFLNVCIWRVPRGESIVSPPSHCPKCGHRITLLENIPIVSYLALRGKCSSCREGISPRYIIIEALTGILYLLLFLSSFPGRHLMIPGYFVLLPILICCAMTDCELGIIPDEFNYLGIIMGLVCSLFLQPRLYYFLLALFSVLTVGGVMALFAMLGKMIFHREALGWGDVKFLAMIAAFTGLPGVLFTILAGSLGGLILFPVVNRLKGRRRRTIKFGPYLAVSAIAWMFFGPELFRVYLNLIRMIAER